jgi:uncharacterized membrane protein YjjB (DUF3815 family)
MILAGIVTCGFAVFYNTAWSHVGMAAVGGMAGHGLRFVALEAGCRLEAATFLGGLAVGIVSGWMARAGKTPVAVIAFAGAVTMMPGLQMYRALAGALQFARLGQETGSAAMAGTLGNASQACIVVSGLALGLILAARVVLGLGGELARREYSPLAPAPTPPSPPTPAEAVAQPDPRPDSGTARTERNTMTLPGPSPYDET